MSINSSAQALGVSASTTPVDRSPISIVGFGHVRRVWTVWRARAADRRAWWKAADDHILRDVGLTREEFVREVSKPCWRK